MIGGLRKLAPAVVLAALLAGLAAAQAPDRGNGGPSVAGPPRAVLIGLIEPVSPGALAGPDTVIARILLDASGSHSSKPIRWKYSGPTLILIPQAPGDGPPNSVAIAHIAAPGTYRFIAVARGTDAGEPDADAAMYQCTLGGQVGPQPVQPAQPVQPNPPRPFPSSSLPAPQRPRA